MRRLVLVLLAAAVLGPVTAVYAVSALGASAADGKLVAIVGPGESIELRDASGSRVTRLTPGTYDIEIDDRSAIHNFHLYGPGVDVSTEIAFVGVRTVTVTIGNGEYTYLCDDHPYTMLARFTAGAATTTTTTSTTPLAGRLVATVGPGATISLTRGGVKVTALKRGLYSITVRDRSKFHNFHLRGPIVAGKPPLVNKATGVLFVGNRTWQVRLRPGLYRYFCDPHRTTMRGSFRVRTG
jgi:plastocyanin